MIDSKVNNSRIVEILLDERTVVRRNPDVEQEREVAIYDILEKNYFSPLSNESGPFKLKLGLEEGKVLFGIKDSLDNNLQEVKLDLKPLDTVIRDYFIICNRYYEAIKTSPLEKIESIDIGRRSIQNAGADALESGLVSFVDIDFNTARRLFTLICVLQIHA